MKEKCRTDHSRSGAEADGNLKDIRWEMTEVIDGRAKTAANRACQSASFPLQTGNLASRVQRSSFRDKVNFVRQPEDLNLMSSSTGWSVASAHCLLGLHLDEKPRALTHVCLLSQ